MSFKYSTIEVAVLKQVIEKKNAYKSFATDAFCVCTWRKTKDYMLKNEGLNIIPTRLMAPK